MPAPLPATATAPVAPAAPAGALGRLDSRRAQIAELLDELGLEHLFERRRARGCRRLGPGSRTSRFGITTPVAGIGVITTTGAIAIAIPTTAFASTAAVAL
jgi:hypothetical protein